jgi:hypothetical protein
MVTIFIKLLKNIQLNCILLFSAVLPSVVQIEIKQTQSFFQSGGKGSGFIVSEDGLMY